MVPGGDRPGWPHLHPAPGLHPHHPWPEQEVHQESRIRWAVPSVPNVLISCLVVLFPLPPQQPEKGILITTVSVG